MSYILGSWTRDLAPDSGIIRGANNTEIATVDMTWPDGEQNANLVAAAPDLLSALQLAVKYLEHPDVQSIPFALNASAAADRANNAITKAMGAGV